MRVFFCFFVGFICYLGNLHSVFADSRSLFHSPVGENFWIHPGEDFVDELYFHSYSGRRFHTGEDYILRWKGETLQTKVKEEELVQWQRQYFGYVPEEADFWKNAKRRIEFLKINIYRTDQEIVDTSLGLYPKTKDDKNYGYKEPVFAIYDGIVEEEVSPEKPKGWGKAILIRHEAPKNKKFIVEWNEKVLHLGSVWSQYAHTEKNYYKKGDRVKKGDKIALIGDGNGIFQTKTGVMTIREGAHLHFEIRIRKYKLFPDPSILVDRKKLETIYIKPSYFLEHVKILPER